MKKKHIHIFRTNVNKPAEIRQLSPVLNVLSGEEGKWNFDLEDCDRILRVESSSPDSLQIRQTLVSRGFFIEELED